MNIGIENSISELINSIRLIVICLVFYIFSKSYKNFIKAHQRPIYNTVNYENCDIYREKEIR